MKVVILCGGLGTRLGEETVIKPKPMVEVGGKPILWHIMSIYASQGYNDFVIALGYKGHLIKDYFLNYFYQNANLKIDLSDGSVQADNCISSNWKVELVDTGEDTLTGGRVKRLEEILKEGPFMLTYGDGVADVDLKALVDLHNSEKRLATVTAVRPAGRFGVIQSENNQVMSFMEKPQTEEGWINGGFFVFEPGVFEYFIHGDKEILERYPLEKLTEDHQLSVYKHRGFWQCMDTLRDKGVLEELWASGEAPWKIW